MSHFPQGRLGLRRSGRDYVSSHNSVVGRIFPTIFAGVLIATAVCPAAATDAAGFALTRLGRPAATIVVAAQPTDAAAFAAQELQQHVEKITGAVLPIKSDAEKVAGPRILVGAGAAAAKLGVEPSGLKDQEYWIRFVGDSLLLLGRDAPARTHVVAAPRWATFSQNDRLPPPAWNQPQATSYAVHDFLERCCGVRWYGPGDLEMVVPKTPTLTVPSRDIRRRPAFPYRAGGPQGAYGPVAVELANHAGGAEQALLWARLRLGGEDYSCNHSFYGFYDRFWAKNPQCPQLFVAAHPDWFAQGQAAGGASRPGQMCYNNEGFIGQVVRDARRWFDKRELSPGSWGASASYALVPMDDDQWCKCPACQAQLRLDERKKTEHFSNGVASDYWFGFVNKVAREVAKTHPDKRIATIAYWEYADYPQRVRLEPNVSVQMCLHVRNWWAPGMEENDLRFYRDWVGREKGRPLYLWLYYCFPQEIAMGGGFREFPGFSAHTLDRQWKMFARDGIRGAYLNGIGEQVDFYATAKLMDDPTLDIDQLLDEFFRRYYGAAAAPMKRLYLRIESIYSDPANYPEEVQKNRNKHFHQTEEMAWKYLGTEARLAELGALMDEATRAAATDVEKRRVALFRKGVWDHMTAGRRQYLAKTRKKP